MTDKPKHAGGRPTKYTPEMCERICYLVATHGWGIQRLCRAYPDIPVAETINQWRHQYPQFSEQYLNSRMKQTHAMFESGIDEVEKIADYFYQDPTTGAMKVDAGIVAAQKAIANQKTQQAARINPRVYGIQKQSEENSSDDTLSKIKSLVDDLNKTNSSEI